MPPALVILDCDGVLVDSERIAVKVDVEILGELGWPLTEAEVVDRFIGASNRHFREEVERHLGRTLPATWEADLDARLRERFAGQLQPVPGIVDALDRITLPTCVASSGTHEKMRYTLGLTGLHDRFAGRVFSATEVRRGKPAPDLFLHAASRMGVDPQACVVVEDSPRGAAAARSAGMRVLGYAGGLTRADRLAGPATTVFTDMRDLPGLLY